MIISNNDNEMMIIIDHDILNNNYNTSESDDV